MRSNPRPCSNDRAGTDGDKGANRGPCPNLGSRINHGHRMDTRRNLWAGVHHHGQPCHRQTTTRRKDRRLQPQRQPIGPGPQHGRPRLTLRQPVGIARVHRQGEIPCPRHRRFGRTPHPQRQIAHRLSAQCGGNFGNRMGHDVLRSVLTVDLSLFAGQGHPGLGQGIEKTSIAAINIVAIADLPPRRGPCGEIDQMHRHAAVQ